MSRRTALVLLAVVLAAFVSGCTDGGPASAVSSSTHGAPSASPDPLAESASSAVSARSREEDSFVERGRSTVQQGVRHLSPLTKGKGYEVVVACAGEGAVDVTIGAAAAREQNCDGEAGVYRIPSAPPALAIVVKGRPGASGAVAWRVNAEEYR